MQVSSALNDLDAFLKRIEPGVEAITGEERDIISFMRLMRIFNEVKFSYGCYAVSLEYKRQYAGVYNHISRSDNNCVNVIRTMFFNGCLYSNELKLLASSPDIEFFCRFRSSIDSD